MFDFNASLNAVAPVSPILHPVDLMKMEKSCLLMNAFCVLFHLCSHPPRWSFVSVVFDFNASLNDVAPLSPILFSIDWKRNKKVGWWMPFVCCFCCLHHSD